MAKVIKNSKRFVTDIGDVVDFSRNPWTAMKLRSKEYAPIPSWSLEGGAVRIKDPELIRMVIDASDVDESYLLFAGSFAYTRGVVMKDHAFVVAWAPVVQPEVVAVFEVSSERAATWLERRETLRYKAALIQKGNPS